MDLLTIRDLKGVQISPDGRKVAFVLVQAVYETNSYRSGLFVVDTVQGSLPKNLGTAGPPRFDQIGQISNYIVTWSPDSQSVTCLINDNDSWQIWRLTNDGRREQLTHSSADVQEYEWSPDGKKIIFTTSEPLDVEAAKRVLESGILYDGTIRAYGRDTFPRLVLDAKPRKKQTWVYEIESRKERTATPEEQIRLNKPSLPELGPEKLILKTKLSSDGRSQLFAVTNYSNYSILLKSLVDNTLTQVKAPSPGYILDLWWNKDGSEIYFEQIGPPKTALFAVPVKGGTIREVSKSRDLLFGFSFDRDQSTAVCIRTNPTLPQQIAILDLKTGLPRTLVDVNPEFQNIALSPAVRIEWKNKYGIATHGHLVKPLNYVPGKRYPLIVTTYASGGFLRGAAGDEYPIQVFAANGFVVLDFNEPPRTVVRDGDFSKTKMIWDSPMESLTTAMKMLDDMGLVEANKKGLSGLSFGSEITAYTISHSNLFQAAAMSSSGSYDPYVYDLGDTGWQKFMATWGLGRPQGQIASRWREISASLNADRINAPVLIQISDSEVLTSLMFRNTLKELNKPVEMFVYADELHVKNQPKHRYEIYQRNLDWFMFWLQGKENAATDNPQQYERWRAMRDVMNKSQVSSR
jgi:dipeptidyl aminopeptidase/acylaminoacyl peptidase